jgi:hypothetical protein
MNVDILTRVTFHLADSEITKSYRSTNVEGDLVSTVVNETLLSACWNTPGQEDASMVSISIILTKKPEP